MGFEGEDQETIMLGQTADISPYIEHAWYDWIYYWDTTSKHPDDKEQLGKWLGPVIDIEENSFYITRRLERKTTSQHGLID